MSTTRACLALLATFALVALPFPTAAAEQDPPAITEHSVAAERLIFGMSMEDDDVELVSVGPDGTGLARITDSPGFDGCPDLSPDGRSIAFCSDRSGTFEIWEMGVDGSDPHQVTTMGGMATFPDYSPDGARITFAGTVDGATQIFTVERDGTELVALTDDLQPDEAPMNTNPVWSPDGSRIAWTSRRTGTGQIWVMDADGGNQSQLTFDAVDKGQTPDWSPDGTRIAYAGAIDDDVDVWVMDADGSDQVRLTTTTSTDIGAAWSPDGSRIAFLSDRDDPERLVYVMDADGSHQHPLTDAGFQFVPAWGMTGPPANLATATIAGHVIRMGQPYAEGAGGVALATPEGLWAPDGLHVVVHRTDPESLGYLGATDLGGTPGAFPPDAQSIAPGKDGIWVTLAAQREVALIDPHSGELVRRIAVAAEPYNLVEAEGDLWIADFEGSRMLRLDLDSEEVVAAIPVRDPTGIAFGEGSVWVTVHVGRHDEAEPIDGNGGQLVRIDPATNQVSAVAEVGPRPYFVTTGFGAAWTGNATGGSVSRVDAITNEVTTIPIGADGAFDIEVLGDSVWVVIGPQYWSPECDPATSFFVRIDPATNEVDGRVPFPCPENLTPDGDRLWVQGIDERGGLVGLVEPARR